MCQFAPPEMDFTPNTLADRMNIRKFESEDRSPLIELWSSSFPDDPPHNDPGKVIDAKLAVDDLIFVAEENGTILGACMAGYDGHRGWLYSVAVQSHNRRSGIGTELIKHTLQNLKDLGCLKVNLQIRSNNVKLVPFYESLGFEIEDRLSMGHLLE